MLRLPGRVTAPPNATKCTRGKRSIPIVQPVVAVLDLVHVPPRAIGRIIQTLGTLEKIVTPFSPKVPFASVTKIGAALHRKSIYGALELATKRPVRRVREFSGAIVAPDSLQNKEKSLVVIHMLYKAYLKK